MKIETKNKIHFTLDELLGLDKFNLTYKQRCDCITLYNHIGQDVAIEQAKKFESINQEDKP